MEKKLTRSAGKIINIGSKHCVLICPIISNIVIRTILLLYGPHKPYILLNTSTATIVTPVLKNYVLKLKYTCPRFHLYCLSHIEENM